MLVVCLAVSWVDLDNLKLFFERFYDATFYYFIIYGILISDSTWEEWLMKRVDVCSDMAVLVIGLSLVLGSKQDSLSQDGYVTIDNLEE